MAFQPMNIGARNEGAQDGGGGVPYKSDGGDGCTF